MTGISSENGSDVGELPSPQLKDVLRGWYACYEAHRSHFRLNLGNCLALDTRTRKRARYYGNRIARFTTVDPVSTLAENVPDPQRWNRYAYERNNPLKFF